MADALQIDPRIPETDQYTVRAAPNLARVTPGAVVRYTAEYTDRHGYIGRRHGFRWYKFADRAVVRGGDGVPILKSGCFKALWACKWKEKPGRYVVGCRVWFPATETARWAFKTQRIDHTESVIAQMLGQARKNGAAHPDEAEGQVKGYIRALTVGAEKFPIADAKKKKKHDQAVARIQKYLKKLNERLEETKALIRIPIHAVHLSTITQQKTQLNVFVAKNWSASETDEQKWHLVDWTDPSQRNKTHEVEATGETDEEAIKELIESWDDDGNRYPDGQLLYEIPKPVCGKLIRDQFKTNGKTRLDYLTDGFGYLAMAGVVVAGVATLVAPVPGSRVVSAAIWTSLLSSTAGATLSIIARHQEGFGNWRDDAIDGLTIAANLLGGAGSTARTVGKGAGWAKGATVKMKDHAGKVVKYTLIGQVSADGAQGILVLSKEMEKYEKIMSDKTMMPDERTKKLIGWIRDLAANGMLTAVSIRSSLKDIEVLAKQNKHLLSTEETPLLMPPKEKLEKLGDPTQEIDLTQPVPTEGHTGEGSQTTKVDTEPEVPAWEEKTRPDIPAATAEKVSLGRQETFTRERYVIYDEDGFYVFAQCMNGELTIDIKTRNSATDKSKTLRGSQEYPKIFEHFEKQGNPVQKVKSSYAENNLERFNELVAGGMDPKQAVLESHTGRYYGREGFTEVTTLRLWPDTGPPFTDVSFVIERPGGGGGDLFD